MVKVKVVKRFRDKENKKIYEKGDTRTISEERLEEIRKAGRYVEAIKEEPPEESEENGSEEHEPEEQAEAEKPVQEDDTPGNETPTKKTAEKRATAKKTQKE